MTTSEILRDCTVIFNAFFEIFIKGLINFENPLMSLIDYMLWLPLIFAGIKKLFRTGKIR